MDENGLTWFQYQKDLDLPVYIRIDLRRFSPEVIGFLTQMRFQELSKKESEKSVERLNSKGERGRVLLIERASGNLVKQIDTAARSDRYGPESVTQGRGYSVYRYKKMAVMVWSFQMTRWELGCFEDFGAKEKTFACRTIVNRFLSYALASLGIAGLWGAQSGEGIVLLKQKEGLGQAVFVDVRNRKVISVGGVKEMDRHFKIVRASTDFSGRETSMGFEELLCALFAHSTYLDYEGPSVPVRQVLQTLAKLAEGVSRPAQPSQVHSDLLL